MLTAWLRPRSTASVTIVLEELAKRAPRSVFFTSASISMRLNDLVDVDPRHELIQVHLRSRYLVQVHPVEYLVQVHPPQHGIQVNPGDQRVHIERLDDEVDHALRNSLRYRLYLPGEPPARRASDPFTWIHTLSMGNAEPSCLPRGE